MYNNSNKRAKLNVEEEEIDGAEEFIDGDEEIPLVSGMNHNLL